MSTTVGAFIPLNWGFQHHSNTPKTFQKVKLGQNSLPNHEFLREFKDNSSLENLQPFDLHTWESAPSSWSLCLFAFTSWFRSMYTLMCECSHLCNLQSAVPISSKSTHDGFSQQSIRRVIFNCLHWKSGYFLSICNSPLQFAGLDSWNYTESLNIGT